MCAELAALGFWPNGWLAVRQTRHFDEKDKQSENYDRLTKLERLLRPRTLIEKVRGQVLNLNGWYQGFEEEDPDKSDHRGGAENNIYIRDGLAEELGAKVAVDEVSLQELLSDIVRGDGNVFHFGRGLARGSPDPAGLWNKIVEEFARSPTDARDLRALRGMLWELSSKKSDLADHLLDAAIDSDPLDIYFPYLQGAVPVCDRGLRRLIKSIDLGKSPVHAYTDINLGSSIEEVSGAAVENFYSALAARPGGEMVAIHSISMQLFSDQTDKRHHTPEIIAIGRELLMSLNFSNWNNNNDFHIQSVVEACGAGEAGRSAVESFCKNLKRAFIAREIYGFDRGQLLTTLFGLQPITCLDAFLTGDSMVLEAAINLIEQATRHQTNPLDSVAVSILIAWCEADPSARFPIAASVVSAFSVSELQNATDWRPIAAILVHGAPDPISVMRILIGRFGVISSRAESRSIVYEENAGLLARFDTRGNAILEEFIGSERKRILKEARDILEWESNYSRDRDERFE